MILVLKILVILGCTLIAFQDFKERAVTWTLFPIVGILMVTMYLVTVDFAQVYPFVLTNLFIVSLIVLLLWAYTRYISKMEFLNVSFGLGDLLFFYAFAIGFPTITFLILFVAAIVFSLVVFLFAKTNDNDETIPLAGLMSTFLGVILMVSFFPESPSLYLL